MLSSVHAVARRALVGAATVVLVLSALPAAVAAQDSGADTATNEPLDELIALNRQAWNEDADLVREVYAPDAVHTATFYDGTDVHEGVEAIVGVARMGGTINEVAPRVDIPAAAGYRWAGFSDFAGGTVCLWRAFDGQIVRHDCLLSANGSEIRPGAGLADGSGAAAIDEILVRLTPAWGGGLEALEAVYAPDAVHTARYLNRTMRYEGPEEIHAVARNGGPSDLIGDRVEFEAPDGELAWAQVSDIMGGTVCLYRARDGMITRHDCLLPIAA
jgi:hypothetical protein